MEVGVAIVTGERVTAAVVCVQRSGEGEGRVKEGDADGVGDNSNGEDWSIGIAAKGAKEEEEGGEEEEGVEGGVRNLARENLPFFGVWSPISAVWLLLFAALRFCCV